MQGYVRAQGAPGIRNTLQVIFLVECAHHVAKSIAYGFPPDEVQYFGFPGCYPSEYGFQLVQKLATHPNVGAVLLVSLGCECFDRNRLEQEIIATGRPCRTLVIQENQGTAETIRRGKEWIVQTREQLAKVARCPLSFSDLVIGTVCGGSDGTSGITGNPAVGRAFDYLLQQQAICMFEESGELIGCEEHMMSRAIDDNVRADIDQAMSKARRYYSIMGLGSFSDGNAVGGLTTQEEKSLGAYAKSGNSPISGVVKPTQRPTSPGLYLMDVVPDGEPRFGYPNICDTAEIMELIATGCHIILFTTGRGSVIGSVIAPVIKVCNNPQTYHNLSDDMDINAGRIISEGASLDDVAQEIVTTIEQVAAGGATKAELSGHYEFVLTYKSFDFQGKNCQ